MDEVVSVVKAVARSVVSLAVVDRRWASGGADGARLPYLDELVHVDLARAVLVGELEEVDHLGARHLEPHLGERGHQFALGDRARFIRVDLAEDAPQRALLRV